MPEVKLQFSIICQWSDGKNVGNIYNGFNPGKIEEFYIINKWLWDESSKDDLIGKLRTDNFYQETKLIEIGQREKLIACSKSDNFRVKNSHTHNNLFHNLIFKDDRLYRVEVVLFSSVGKTIKSGSTDYPLFIKKR